MQSYRSCSRKIIKFCIKVLTIEEYYLILYVYMFLFWKIFTFLTTILQYLFTYRNIRSFFIFWLFFIVKKKTITNCFSYCFFNFKFFENNKFSIEIRLHDFFPRTFNKQKEGYIKFIYLIHEKYKISMTP